MLMMSVGSNPALSGLSLLQAPVSRDRGEPQAGAQELDWSLNPLLLDCKRNAISSRNYSDDDFP